MGHFDSCNACSSSSITSSSDRHSSSTSTSDCSSDRLARPSRHIRKPHAHAASRMLTRSRDEPTRHRRRARHTRWARWHAVHHTACSRRTRRARAVGRMRLRTSSSLPWAFSNLPRLLIELSVRGWRSPSVSRLAVSASSSSGRACDRRHIEHRQTGAQGGGGVSGLVVVVVLVVSIAPPRLSLASCV